MRRTKKSIALHLPEEISGLIKGGAFPEDSSNPIVVFEFRDGTESLFDTRKGLFISPPSGIKLPCRESLKAFGRLIMEFRTKNLSLAPPAGDRKADVAEPMIGHFEVCC